MLSCLLPSMKFDLYHAHVLLISSRSSPCSPFQATATLVEGSSSTPLPVNEVVLLQEMQACVQQAYRELQAADAASNAVAQVNLQYFAYLYPFDIFMLLTFLYSRCSS